MKVFEKVFKLAVEATFGPPLPNPYERYYIVSTASTTWRDLAHRFARELHKRDGGIVDSPEASSVSFEQAGSIAS